jgi:hypothetical protein
MLRITMNCDPIIVAGIEIPCDSPIFLTVLGFHVMFGLACVITGPVAMLSKKRPGRHPKFGTIYYWCLSVVFISACILSAMRWAEDYHLFILGTLSFGSAWLGRTAHHRDWRGWVKLHIIGMGLSYVLMLTAFYVDNGERLPVWNRLPSIAFWLLPGAVGIPLIVRTLRQHPLARHPKGLTSASSSPSGKAPPNLQNP